MNLYRPFIISILLLSFISSLFSLPPPLEFKASFSSEVQFASPESNQQYYIVSLADRSPDKSLLISLTSRSDRAPKIYISKNPDPGQASNYSETSSSGYVVLWKGQELTDTPFIYILLVCSLGSCEATLDVLLTKEVSLEANKGPFVYKADIVRLTSTIARLQVPQSADANRIVIHVDTMSTDPSQPSELDLKVNKGDSIPAFNHAENIARDAWYVGRTTVIYQGDNLFCTECQYTLSLKFSSTTELRIEAHTMAAEMILNHKSFLDAVRKGNQNTYYYQVSDAAKNKDVVISLKASQGSLGVKIECAPLPGNSTAPFKLNYEAGRASEQIVLTVEDHNKCLDRKYMMTVEGKEDVTYSIKATAREAANLMIKKDSPVLGSILPEEKIDYEFVIPLYLTEKVKIKLQSKGNVNMEVINCRYYSECPNQLFGAFTHSGPEPNQPNYVYAVTDVDGGKEVDIEVGKEGCYGLEFKKEGMLSEEEREGPVCAFKISLKSADSDTLEYSLSASTEGHQLLYAGHTERGVVTAGQKLYYLLHVTQDLLMSVRFQLTVQSGEAKMFVSKNQEFPEATEGATVDHEGSIVFQFLQKFSGNYYVTVQGIKTSSFLLSTLVISPNSQPIDYATTLQEGDQHKGVMTKKMDERPEHFYKIQLNLQDSWKGKLKITVSTLRGSLLMVMNADATSIPTKGMSDWQTKNHVLEVSSDDEKFRRHNIYHIGLYLNEESLDAIQLRELKEITYTISYVLLAAEKQATGADSYKNQMHLLLTTGFPHHGVIAAGHTLYFKIDVHPNDAPVTLFKRASSGDIDIYLSTDPNNKYPGPENYKLTSTTTHKNELTFQKNDLDPACVQSDQMCYAYFAVSTSANEEVPFTLSLQFHSGGYALDTPTALEDGKERDFKVPFGLIPVKFYFYPTPKENIFIDVACPGKDISIYARVEKLLHGVNVKTEPQYPSSIDAPYSSVTNEDNLNTGAAHLAIPVEADSPALIVTITLEFKDSLRRGFNSAATTFSIVASSHTRHIFPGKPYRGEVDVESYLYFLLDVPKSECTIFVTLTNIDDGDADLYISFGEYQRPTKETHKYASISRQRTELVEISYKDIYPQHDMKGKWVIGIYGKQKSSFVLTASYEDNKLVNLQQSIPVELYLKTDTKMYFKYLHDQNTSFDIRVDKQSGSANVYINVIGAKSPDLEDMPNNENSKWKFTQDKQSFITIAPDDPNFCSDCLYIIGIEITKSSKFTLLITEEGGFTLVQSSLRYSDRIRPHEKKYYMLVLKNSEELQVSASISSGELNIYAHNNVLVSSSINLWSMILNPDSTYGVLTLKKQEFRDKQHVKSIASGNENIISQQNIFYFEFENPSDVATEYSFSMQPPDATVVLKTNQFQDVVFKEEEDMSFLYYSPHITGSLKIGLSYCLEHNGTKQSVDDRSSEDVEGFDSEINYWTEKATAGAGTEIALLRNDVIVDNIQDALKEGDVVTKTVCIKQLLEIEDQEQEGRYEIILTNPYKQKIAVEIRVDATELNFKSLDRNYYGVEHFENDEKRSYQITFSGDGYSYLDFFACSGILTVKYADTLEALQAGQVKEIVISQFGNQREVFYKDLIKGSSSIFFIITTHEVSKIFGDTTAEVLISTSYFTEDTGDYKSNHGLDHLGVLHEPELAQKYDFDYDDSTLHLNFKSIAISSPQPEYNMIYYIRLCPRGVISNKENYCVSFNNPDECYMGHQSAGAGESKVIQHTFGSVPPGEYDLHISAGLSYGDNTVRLFAYKSSSVSVGEPFFNKLWDIVLFFITVGAILFCVYIGFQRLKTSQRAQGYDMKVFKKTRDYGFVGDEDDEDLRSEDDNLRKRDSN